jgi:ABC-type spermidine/putrescine transport system permease subunit I
VAVEPASGGGTPLSPAAGPRRLRAGMRAILAGSARNALALPSVLWTALFFLAPLGLLILYSFGTTNLLTYAVGFGWTTSNYTGIFNSLYVDTILRSFALSAGATIGCLILGFPVAYTIARARGRRQVMLLLAVMVPFWTSFVVRTYGVFNVISDNGPIYQLLHSLGLVHHYIHLLFTPIGVGIGIVYTYMPLMILPLYVALERIDPALLDAAHDLGASPARSLRRVVLPMAKPGIVAGCVLVGIPATGEYVIPQILGGGQTLMYGNVVSDQFLDIGNYPFGAALAVALTLVLIIVLMLARSRSYRGEAGIA